MRPGQLQKAGEGSPLGRRAKAETSLEIVTHSAAETIECGRMLARQLAAPCLVLLQGDLGSGKTTLTKGIVSGLRLAQEDEVTSPSFALVHEYGREKKAYHVDLYRIEGPQELTTLGLEELFAQPAVVVVEWGEKLGKYGARAQFRIKMEYLASDDRKITVERLVS